MTYNLSILCVDGTIFGCISTDKHLLRVFLNRYDHEGASVGLVRHAVPGELDFKEVPENEIYTELL